MMKKIIFILLPLFLLCSCATTGKFSGKTQYNSSVSESRDGSSYEKAVVIVAKNEKAGINAEYSYILKNYPGYKLKGQVLTEKNKVPYDIIDIITASGESKSVYFDISKFFGKF
jgi:hypothetical protein